jgi:hypothetical protein
MVRLSPVSGSAFEVESLRERLPNRVNRVEVPESAMKVKRSSSR